ncbi:hypothetical protein ACIBL8_47310 [Streptomyces sp. NPDC050523]|uniref:hypothetical protein n=1 Tax=Streptomyces sp. NPDC050523 TaxID=3365622 RepID=UPI0037A6E6B5
MVDLVAEGVDLLLQEVCLVLRVGQFGLDSADKLAGVPELLLLVLDELEQKGVGHDAGPVLCACLGELGGQDAQPVLQRDQVLGAFSASPADGVGDRGAGCRMKLRDAGLCVFQFFPHPLQADLEGAIVLSDFAQLVKLIELGLR